MRLSCLIPIALIAGIGCAKSAQNEAVSPEERVPAASRLLDRSQLDLLLEKAASGDTDAMKSVQLHYMTTDDSQNYLYWLEKEAIVTADAKQRLASYLSEIGGRNNCERAGGLLEEALPQTTSVDGRLVIENQMKVLRGEVPGIEGCK
jgi:hypothetical protein